MKGNEMLQSSLARTHFLINITLFITGISILTSQLVAGFTPHSSSYRSKNSIFVESDNHLTGSTVSTSIIRQSINPYNTQPTFRKRKVHSNIQSMIKMNNNVDVQDEEVITSSSDGSSSDDTPLLTFGVIADIQTAPIPDGFSFSGKPRYYRHSLDAASHAAKHFEKEKVSLVVNLGDIIDGKCNCVEKHGGEKIKITSKKIDDDDVDDQKGGVTIVDDGQMGQLVMNNVIDSLSTYKNGPILHTYGNHELYCMKREEIGQTLGIPFVKEEPHGELVGYYDYVIPCSSSSSSSTISPSETSNNSQFNIKFIVLDSYDISVEGRCPDESIKRQKADEILRLRNPNYPELMNSPEGLEGVDKRFVAFNGAIDDPQKQWLRKTLQQSRDKGNERVIILSHQPLFPASSAPVCLVWNYEEVLGILRDYSDIICASFAGHAHRGGYTRDEESKIHFRVFEAMLESNHPVKTYGFCDVYDDRLVVRGQGDCKSDVYLLDHLS